MKSVEKNTFYKSTSITKGIAIKPNYSDLAWGGTETTITLKGGVDPTYYAISGNLATTPKYGESKLIGGYMQLYTSSVEMPNVPSMPQVQLYKAKQNTTVEEGTMRLAYASGTVVTGAETGQDISVYRSGVSTDNFFTIENFDGGDKTIGEVKMIRSLGNGTAELGQAYLLKEDALAYGIALGRLLGDHKEEVLDNYFMEKVTSADGRFAFGQRCFIKPEGEINGVWRAAEDRRKGNNKAIVKRPYWKYKDIKSKIKFAQVVGTSSDIESSVLGSKGNTIFDDVYGSSSVNNPFTASETNPLMMTSCELSTAKKYSGGQAFRMYHLWDYSTTSNQLQLAMGARGINPSCTRASIYNLPQPHMGLDAADQVSDDVGWQSKLVPTIDMRMNISKLAFTPYLTLNMSSPTRGYTNGTAYYPSGATNVTSTYNSTTYTSLLRSVAITFSNYKPKANHTTLDRFLDYGLSRFYAEHTTEHIVGGVIFMKNGIDSKNLSVDPSMITATAIPVAPYMDATAGTANKYGLVKLTASASAGIEDTLNLGSTKWMSPTAAPLKEVEIPQDSWFNTKFVIDAWAPNTTKSAQNDLYNSYTTTALEEAGVPMRAYFDISVDPSGSTEFQDPLETNPYLDIFFPATSGTAAYNFSNPTNYPKHMTVWVQNYRWVSGSQAEAISYDNSYGIFHYGDNQGSFPSGAAIEAELFIDDIKLSNFTPDVENVSAGASIRNQQYFTFRDEAVVSPFQRYSVGAGSALTSIRGWAASGATTSGAMVERDMDENMVFGFEDTYQLPRSTGGDWATDAFGYILCNGFSTANFASLNAVIPLTATVSVSGTNTNQKYLGGQFFGNHYIDVTDEVDTTGTDFANTTLSGACITVHNDATTTMANKATGSISLMTGTSTSIPSQDAFTTKGLFRFGMSGSGFDAANTWTRRENVLASTKIIQVPGMTSKLGEDGALGAYQLRVENPQIFNKYLDESYIIYRMGKVIPTVATGSANTLGWGKKGVTGVNEIKLSKEIHLDEGPGIVTFDQSIITSDTGTSLCVESNIGELWISPKKYWLNLRWAATQTARTYQNFCIVQNVTTDGTSAVAEPDETSMSGATWNESTYSYDSTERANIGRSGLYLRGWDLAATEESTLELNKDYGYGTFNQEEQSGGQVATANAKLNNYIYLDMMGLARDRDVEQGESLVFRIGIESTSGEQSLAMHSDESADILKRPTMYWQYKDNLPIFTSPLTVSPNFDILSGSGSDKVDLYKLDRENLNAIRFNWEEEGDDVVYRLLYIDSSPIEDKYHKILFHAPMNEIPSADLTIAGSYYSSGTSLATAFNNTSKRQITGSAGWAFNGEGSNIGPRTAASWTSPWFGKTKATFVVHCVPNDTTAGNRAPHILSDYDSFHGSVKMGVNKTGGANVDVVPFITLVKGTGTYSGNEVTITSDYSFRNDGESPLFIVVTFDATLTTNNIKMYVNGRLVKQSGTSWTTGDAIYSGGSYPSTGFFMVGQSGQTNPSGHYWYGTIEEIIVHDDVLYVPTEPNEYLLTTEDLPDRASGVDIDYIARLFLFDHHNIIGTANDEVATSNTVRWGATGI